MAPVGMNPYRLVAVAGYCAYRNSLVGNPAPIVKAYYDRATNPIVGDLVVETTTIGGWRTERDRERRDVDVEIEDGRWWTPSSVGILLEVGQEPIVTKEAHDEMKAAGDYWKEPDEPYETVPTQLVHYVDPLDPAQLRRVRWEDASFVAIPKSVLEGLW